MTANDQPTDPQAEVNALRDRVAALSTPASPAVAQATATAQAYVSQAKQTVTEKAETLSGWARQAPFKSLLAACAAGYLVGRVVR